MPAGHYCRCLRRPKILLRITKARGLTIREADLLIEYGRVGRKPRTSEMSLADVARESPFARPVSRRNANSPFGHTKRSRGGLQPFIDRVTNPAARPGTSIRRPLALWCGETDGDCGENASLSRRLTACRGRHGFAVERTTGVQTLIRSDQAEDGPSRAMLRRNSCGKAIVFDFGALETAMQASAGPKGLASQTTKPH